MTIRCPYCRSSRIEALDRAAQIGGAAGALAGTTSGVAMTWAGAEAGAAIGMLAGPAGSALGGGSDVLGYRRHSIFLSR